MTWLPSQVGWLTTWHHSDFSSFAADDLTDGVAASLTPDTVGGAIDWTPYNPAGANPFDLDNATGARITTVAGKNIHGALNTGAHLGPMVSDLVPGHDKQTPVFFQARMTAVQPAADYDAVVLMLRGAAGTLDDYAMVGRVHDVGPLSFSKRNVAVDSGPDVGSDLFELVWNPGRGVECRLGTWAGRFPLPRTMTEYVETIEGFTAAVADLRACVACYKLNSATAMSATLLAFRAGKMVH